MEALPARRTPARTTWANYLTEGDVSSKCRNTHRLTSSKYLLAAEARAQPSSTWMSRIGRDGHRPILWMPKAEVHDR